MRTALVIAWKDLRQRLRDRSALILAFVAPFGIAVIISFAFGGGFADSFSATYAVVDGDKSDLSKAFVNDVLKAPDFREQIAVVTPKSADAAREIVAGDGAAAAFVIPKGFQADVTRNRRANIRVLRNPNAQIGSEVAVALANGYVDQINAARLSIFTTIRARGGPPDPAAIAALAREATADRIPIQLVDGEIGVRKVTGANYFGPAMAIFFLFFTTGFAARSLLAEREQGTLPRILASPARRSSIVGGKAIAGFVLGITSMAVMFLSLGLLFDVSWGDPFAIVALSAASVLAVLGVTAVVQLLARTQEQADAYSSAVAAALAMVGGNFFPLSQLPDSIQKISLITPNGWALRGFSDVAYDGATIADLGPHLGVMCAFAAVTGTIALIRSRKLAIR